MLKDVALWGELGIGAIVGFLFLLGVAGMLVYRAGKWAPKLAIELITEHAKVREALHDLITSTRSEDDFRDAVSKVLVSSGHCEEYVNKRLRDHDTDGAAHHDYRRSTHAVIQSRAVEAEMRAQEHLENHNNSPHAHHAALARYVTTEIVDSKVSRLEMKMDSFRELMVERDRNHTAQLTRIEKMIEKMENNKGNGNGK